MRASGRRGRERDKREKYTPADAQGLPGFLFGTVAKPKLEKSSQLWLRLLPVSHLQGHSQGLGVSEEGLLQQAELELWMVLHKT